MLGLIEERETARAIVLLAYGMAKKRKLHKSADWFRRDEKGTWEKRALETLERTRAKVAELGMSDTERNEQIALCLLLDATTAELNLRLRKV